MRRELGLVLALLCGPVMAEPAACPQLLAALESATGTRITAPPSGTEDGWCVFDRAVLKADGAPDLVAERLRLRGDLDEGALVSLAVRAGGVRVSPGLGQRDLDPVLREALRLQTAEVALDATVGPEGIALRDGVVRLSGGSELAVAADIAGVGISAGSLMLGRLTWARLDWRNDGKLLRPVLQAWGEGLADGAARGAAAIDASRATLRQIVGNLPEALVPEDGAGQLKRLIDALPQGRGRLVLELSRPGGIGAAELGVAALSRDPLGPEALARLFSGAVLAVDWQPGLAP
ncbi:hypothetical protein [Tabrizicola thermarum]|uniref:hypothetical protein n=1 Tax=Tabrizicola thermarum TaxID=2670345 RepID=UPI000FFB9C32|nr:hypothetical protein [Tabrizicola thermarum]